MGPPPPQGMPPGPPPPHMPPPPPGMRGRICLGLYFFIAAQIVQVARPVYVALAGQVWQSGNKKCSLRLVMFVILVFVQ